MAKQAVSSVGLESMALSSLPADYGPTDSYGGAFPTSGPTEYDHTKWLKDRILDITGISAEERRERIAMQHVSVLDPDLAVSRAFSLSFKVQEQKRRNFERYQEREHRSLKRQLADHLKSKLQ